ncbi:putative F-box protein At5g55150 [Lolium perenne]|uniref:putative F-box protein At5g55150 n=1 Tax=Lolium perenne TaxID=4522 RepID=UPI0021F51744|nr:putative F-box protein At3g25750 [Lolium perenne]
MHTTIGYGNKISSSARRSIETRKDKGMSRTCTAVGHGDGSSRWSELPDDILGMVRNKINSPRDLVRMAAACKLWRDASSQLPATPAVPALILSPGGCSSKKHMCGPNGSWVMHVPSKAATKRFVGSHQGGWIAAIDYRELAIVNLFTGAEVLLSAKQSTIALIPSTSTYGSDNGIKKIIFSQDPSSSNSINGCTLAALRNNRDSISVCRVDCPDGGWSARLWRGELIWDIAFYNGELYCLTRLPEKLVRFEIGTSKDGAPVITATHQLDIQNRHLDFYNPIEYDAYIVELHGKLLIAVRSRWLPRRHECFFRVFELVDANDDKGYKYKWSQVTSFGDYALFLGWSKAIQVPVGGRGGIKANHIYYCMPTMEDKLPDDTVYSVTSRNDDQIYCREEESIKDGVGRTVIHRAVHWIQLWAFLLPEDQRKDMDTGCHKLLVVTQDFYYRATGWRHNFVIFNKKAVCIN